MVESINGHMTRYLETCDRRKEEIENYGIPWKVMEVEGKEIVYIFTT